MLHPGAAPTDADASPKTVLQTYDIRDIGTLELGSEAVTMVNGDRSDPMVIGQGFTQEANSIGSAWVANTNANANQSGASTFNQIMSSPKTSDDIIKEITQLIISTAVPDTWRDSGGTIGSMREVSGTLYVTQTEANQKLVKELLDSVREQLGVQVILDVQAIAVDLPTYEALTKPESSFLTTDQVNDLLHTPAKEGKIAVLARPRITLMSGHTAGVSHAFSKGYMEGWAWVDVPKAESPVKNATTQPANQAMEYLRAQDRTILPMASMITTGWSINVRVAAGQDRKSVVVQMEPSIALLRKLEQIELPENLKKKGLYPSNIETPDIERISCAATLSIPNGEYAVVGGQKLKPEEKPGESEHFMVFLVRPTIVEPHHGNTPIPHDAK